MGWASIPPFGEESDDPLDAIELRAGAWTLPVVPGPWKADGPWPPPASRGFFSLKARFFHAAAPPAPRAVDPRRAEGDYVYWGEEARGATPSPPRPRRRAHAARRGHAHANDDGGVFADETARNQTLGEAPSASSLSASLGGFSLPAAHRDTMPARAEMVPSDDEGLGKGDDDDDAVDDERGFLDKTRPAATEPFVEGSGVDVFVDGCRGLPDNAGASRVTLRLSVRRAGLRRVAAAPRVSDAATPRPRRGRVGGDASERGSRPFDLLRRYSQGAPIGPDRVAECRPDGLRFCPRFDLNAEFREAAFDPTSTLFVRIDALDEDAPAPANNDDASVATAAGPKCLGYALLNLFHQPGDADEQPTDKHAQGFCLGAGGWQLPLCMKPAPDVQTLRHDSLRNRRRWPGASPGLGHQPARCLQGASRGAGVLLNISATILAKFRLVTAQARLSCCEFDWPRRPRTGWRCSRASRRRGTAGPRWDWTRLSRDTETATTTRRGARSKRSIGSSSNDDGSGKTPALGRATCWTR